MRQRMKKAGEALQKKIKKSISCRQGATLVELVVTFILLALFATGTCQIASTAIRVYHQIRGLNQGMQVCDTLMDKITGEIEGAWVSVPSIEEDSDGKIMKIYDSGNIIELRDRTGSRIAITSTEHKNKVEEVQTAGSYDSNQLLIYYYPVTTTADGGSVVTGDDNIRYKEVDWTYDKAMYMGFEIKSLTFSQADPNGVVYPKNVIKVVLNIGGSGGSFTATRYVECYNFSTEQDFDKIVDEGGQGPGGGTDEPEEPEQPEQPENPGGDVLGDLDFVVGDEIFTSDVDMEILYEEENKKYMEQYPGAGKAPGVSTPKAGFYKVGEDYYYAHAGAWYSNGVLGSFSVKINQEKISDYTLLVDVSNPDSKKWITKPNVGDVVIYKNEYYLVTGGGISPWQTPNTLDNWVKLNPKE